MAEKNSTCKSEESAGMGPSEEKTESSNHCSPEAMIDSGPFGDTGISGKSKEETTDKSSERSDKRESWRKHTGSRPPPLPLPSSSKPNSLLCSTKNGDDNDSNGNNSNANASDGENLKPDEGFVLGAMKKDDSGIDIEKSPTSVKDHSGLSDGEGDGSVSESFFTDSAACSRTNSVSDSKLDDKLKRAVDEAQAIADTSDYGGDGAFSIEVENISTDIQDQSINENSNETENDSSDAGMRSSDQSGAVGRRRQRSSSTSSDLDRTDDESKSKKSTTSDTEEEEFYAQEDPGPIPKHGWRAMPELLHREMGRTNKMSSLLFQERVTGCLRMVQRLELMGKLDYHEGCVNTLSFNRIGTLLASGSDDLNIVLWNWVRSKPVLIFDSGHRANVFQAKFMPYSGDCHVISCARDGQVRLAELSLTGICKGTKKLAQHKGAAHKLALEYDSPHTFLSCGEDAVMFEVDLRTDKPNKLGTTKENDRKVALYSIHSNPSNSFEYCVGGRDHFIRVYDKRKIDEEVNGGVLKKFCPQHLVNSDVKANVTCACYNYNGKELLGTYNDEDIYLFDSSHSEGADYIHKYKGHRNNATVKGVNFYGPKSQFIVSGSDCGHVYLWDKETEKVVQYMEGDVGGVVNVLEPHPQAPVLATSGLDHDVKIWAPSAEQATSLKGLRKMMRKNRRDRDDERTNEPEMIDGQMLWFLMHHLRRSARRRARQDGEEVSSSSENSQSESDGEEEAPNLQCVPS